MFDGFTAPFISVLAVVFQAIFEFVAVFYAVGIRKTIVISADLRLLGLLFAIFRLTVSHIVINGLSL